MKKNIIILIGCILCSCGIFDSKGSAGMKKLYVCLQHQNQVAVYDTPSLNLLKLIDINYSNDGNTPHFIVIDEENYFWFVTGLDGGYIAQFNLITDEFIDTIFVGSNPALMTIDPISKTLFCSRMNMSDMPGGMGGMGGMGDMVQTNIITEVHYTDTELSLGREFTLQSNVLHGITYDYNKENIITASITDDWLYKIPLDNDPIVSNTLDPLVTEFVNNNPNNLQPLQIISLNDSLIAISCSAFKDGINGQVQVWNTNSLNEEQEIEMDFVTSYEFNEKSIPWHLIKSPISDEIFIVLGGSSGNGGVACLTYSENAIDQKWRFEHNLFNTLHGITIDENREYIYVTSRGDNYLYQFNAVTGTLVDSSPLGADNQPVSPGGLSVMQNICTDCE